jgi:hypothetical protein
MKLENIFQMWSTGLILGIKIYILGLIFKYPLIFILGLTAAACGSLPPFVSIGIVVVLGVLFAPFLVVLLAKLFQIDNSSNKVPEDTARKLADP